MDGACWCLWYSPVLHHKCLLGFEFGFLTCFGIHSLLLLLSSEIKEGLVGCIEKASTSWITLQTGSGFESECTHVHVGISRRARMDANHIVAGKKAGKVWELKTKLCPL